MTSSEKETAAEFLADRADWLEVVAVDKTDGHGGWDIMLRLDGTYSMGDEAKVEMVKFFQQRVTNMLRTEGLRKRH